MVYDLASNGWVVLSLSLSYITERCPLSLQIPEDSRYLTTMTGSCCGLLAGVSTGVVHQNIWTWLLHLLGILVAQYLGSKREHTKINHFKRSKWKLQRFLWSNLRRLRMSLSLNSIYQGTPMFNTDSR